jgi:outer membrane immunogenic protein
MRAGSKSMSARKNIAAVASLGMAVAFGVGNQAFGADLPTMKGPPPAPPPPPPFSWTGFYIGAHVGGDWDYDRFHFTPAGTTTNNSASSILGGGQAGYNYQISSFVLGVEGDISGMHLASSAACPNPFFTCGHSIDWLSSARGRVGFTPFDRALIYVTGGAAFTDIHHTALPPGVAPFVFSGTFNSGQVGWAFGGGVEYAFTKNWSVKVEDIYYGFQNTASPGTLSAANSTHVTTNINTVDVGVNYHF